MSTTKEFIDINSMDGDYTRFAYYLSFTEETSKSIYGKGMYGDTYRIEKSTGKVFKNGKQIAETSEWEAH